jgi:hypothetical protein
MMVLALVMLFSVQQLLASLVVTEQQGLTVVAGAGRTGPGGLDRTVSPAKPAIFPALKPPEPDRKMG